MSPGYRKFDPWKMRIQECTPAKGAKVANHAEEKTGNHQENQSYRGVSHVWEPDPSSCYASAKVANRAERVSNFSKDSQTLAGTSDIPGDAPSDRDSWGYKKPQDEISHFSNFSNGSVHTAIFSETHGLLKAVRFLYRRVLLPLGRQALTETLGACCFGVADWAALPLLAREDLERGLALLGRLCDRMAEGGPPAPGQEAVWCAAETRRREARQPRPEPGPPGADPGEGKDPASSGDSSAGAPEAAPWEV